jgi:LmbE family N-acetylglucosaminyl deacetylase
MQLNLAHGATGELQILCLGSHSDDIEIGCGGTILRLAEQYPKCTFHWVVFSADGVRRAEAQRAAELFTGSAGLKGPFLKTFSDGFMPFAGHEVKAEFEELKRSISPDVIFTHNRKDAHQDHRLLAELTWNTFRDHLILEYEIPKYDGDLGQPGLFVPLPTEVYQKKIRYILDSFQSQHSKRWFREDLFSSLMRLRGMECNAPSGYAEAFYCRKLVLGMDGVLPDGEQLAACNSSADSTRQQ